MPDRKGSVTPSNGNDSQSDQRPFLDFLKQMSIPAVIVIAVLEFVRMRILQVPDGLGMGGFDAVASALNVAVSLIIAFFVAIIVVGLVTIVGILFLSLFHLAVSGSGSVLAASMLTIRRLGLQCVGALHALPSAMRRRNPVDRIEGHLASGGVSTAVGNQSAQPIRQMLEGIIEGTGRFLPADEKTRSAFWGKIGVLVKAIFADLRGAVTAFLKRVGLVRPFQHDRPREGALLRALMFVTASAISFFAIVTNHVRVMESVGVIRFEDATPGIREAAQQLARLESCSSDLPRDAGSNHWGCSLALRILGRPAVVYPRLATKQSNELSFLDVRHCAEHSMDPFLTGPYFHMGDFGDWAYLIAAEPSAATSRAPSTDLSVEQPVDGSQQDCGAFHPRQILLRRTAIMEFSFQPLETNSVPIVVEQQNEAETQQAAIGITVSSNVSFAPNSNGSDSPNLDARLETIEASVLELSQSMQWRYRTTGSDLALARVVQYLRSHDEVREELEAVRQGVYGNERDVARLFRMLEPSRLSRPQQVLLQPLLFDFTLEPVILDRDTVPATLLERGREFELFGNHLYDLWRETCTPDAIHHVETFAYVEGASLPDSSIGLGIQSIMEALSELGDGIEHSVFVIGSASFTGDPLNNLILSEQRAETVSRELGRQILGPIYLDPIAEIEVLRENHNLNLVSFGLGEISDYTSEILPRSVHVWVCAAPI